jgi:hypothetical protein
MATTSRSTPSFAPPARSTPSQPRSTHMPVPREPRPRCAGQAAGRANRYRRTPRPATPELTLCPARSRHRRANRHKANHQPFWPHKETPVTDGTISTSQETVDLSAADEQLLRERRAGTHRRAEADRRGWAAGQCDQDDHRRRLGRRAATAGIPGTGTVPRRCSPIPAHGDVGARDHEAASEPSRGERTPPPGCRGSRVKLRAA